MVGRKFGSMIRQNIIEILAMLGSGYGYQVWKIYRDVFPATSMRNIFYHLKKGVETEEIEIDKVETEKGEYSWGDDAKKIYYKVGKRANVFGNRKLVQYFEDTKLK